MRKNKNVIIIFFFSLFLFVLLSTYIRTHMCVYYFCRHCTHVHSLHITYMNLIHWILILHTHSYKLKWCVVRDMMFKRARAAHTSSTIYVRRDERRILIWPLPKSPTVLAAKRTHTLNTHLYSTIGRTGISLLLKNGKYNFVRRYNSPITVYVYSNTVS